MVTCKLCQSSTEKIFTKTVLKKHRVDYHKCGQCGFIQTSEIHWLEEAYSSAITRLDIGLLDRNIRLRNEISPIIDTCFPDARNFIDYAGGYGILVRLMRDAGFNFYRQDIYCENIFAQHFDVTDVSNTRFDVLTAFEVFEHFTNPLEEIEKLFSYSDNVIFSTELYDYCEGNIEDWWYIAPETGQHVAFYSQKTLEYLAKKLNKKYYTKNRNVHVFTSVNLSQQQIDYAFRNIYFYKKFFGLKTEYFSYKKERKSLLPSDFEYIKSLLQTT